MANKKTVSATDYVAKKQTKEDIADVVTTKKEEPVRFTPKEIDNEQLVVVKNGTHGRLVYKSKRTGELFVWEEFGDEQEIELRELKSAKNTYKKYFENNWFMFEDNWVIDYLGVKAYYKNAIPVSKFDEIFTKSPKELTAIIGKLSAGQKKSVIYRAKQLIESREIDSLNTIDALEKALSVDLIEKHGGN